jgi:nicotinate-nucleotide pyrophosphorylase (carboxylating)
MQLTPDHYMPLIEMALREDIGHGDITSEALIPPMAQASLAIRARQPLVVAGLGVAAECFLALDETLEMEARTEDGMKIGIDSDILILHGNARAILAAERTALNFLQRMCGVATLTEEYVAAIEGTHATILDTRKTLPGWRMLDKYAVAMGGGRNHRLRLDDGVLIKDNHIAVAGSVAEAIERAKRMTPALTKIEIECDTLVQVEQAVAAGADIILLDNMEPSMLKDAVQLGKGHITFEASGGVALETVRSIAETGVDYISVGALTHSAVAVDIGMDFVTLSDMSME